MKKLVVGNWKMNGSVGSAKALIGDVAALLGRSPEILEKCDLGVAPPFLHLAAARETIATAGARLMLGAQDCSSFANGAYTGEVSAEMLRDFGCGFVILGHSERRQHHAETSETVKEKAKQAHAQGLVTIICVGEKELDRDGGYEIEVVGGQMERSIPGSATARNLVIAYEPVWAIGTGRTATPEDVRIMHKFIREKLQEHLADSENIRILYGGSVKPENARDLFAVDNVNGGLVGGASLKAEQFIGIVKAA